MKDLRRSSTLPLCGRICYSFSGDSNSQRLPERTNSPPPPLITSVAQAAPCRKNTLSATQCLPAHTSPAGSFLFSASPCLFHTAHAGLFKAKHAPLHSGREKPSQIPLPRTQPDSGVRPCPLYTHTLKLFITIFLRHG